MCDWPASNIRRFLGRVCSAFDFELRGDRLSMRVKGVDELFHAICPRSPSYRGSMHLVADAGADSQHCSLSGKKRAVVGVVMSPHLACAIILDARGLHAGYKARYGLDNPLRLSSDCLHDLRHSSYGRSSECTLCPLHWLGYVVGIPYGQLDFR